MKIQRKIIIPLSNFDFDPSEVAIPWQMLTNLGFQVEFATPDGKMAFADARMLSGEGLDVWGWIPLVKKIKLIGLMLRANKMARNAYQCMIKSNEFNQIKSFSELKTDDYLGLILPGGHASRVRPYLENKVLQSFVAEFFESKNSEGQHKPIAAICHGVLVAARATSKSSNRSVLYGKKTTALTWKLENSAWKLTKYFARFWEPNYYRTYIENKSEPYAYWGVEQEVKRSLKKPDDFLDVDKSDQQYFLKTSGIIRDTITNSKPAWVVQDGNYFSARWPGDIHTVTKKFINALESSLI